MNLDIKEMIDGTPTRLRYVFRYSTSRVNRPETVAEHSFYVSFYSMLIARWAELRGTKVDKIALYERAIIHDMEEAVTGDFPRPFKRSSEQLEACLADASSRAFTGLLEKIIDECDGALVHPTTSQILHQHWHNAKDGTPAGLILEFADFLSVLSFMMGEDHGSGNRDIRNHVRNMDKYFSTFAMPKFEFIRPLIEQTNEIMKEMFHEEA